LKVCSGHKLFLKKFEQKKASSIFENTLQENIFILEKKSRAKTNAISEQKTILNF
jgi:hypothetical protein